LEITPGEAKTMVEEVSIFTGGAFWLLSCHEPAPGSTCLFSPLSSLQDQLEP